MNDLICMYCGRPIDSRDDLVLGSHFLKLADPYHDSCFEHARRDPRHPDRPYWKVPFRALNLYLTINAFTMMLGLAFMILGLFAFLSISFLIIGCIMTVVGSIWTSAILRYKNRVKMQNEAKAFDARHFSN